MIFEVKIADKIFKKLTMVHDLWFYCGVGFALMFRFSTSLTTSPNFFSLQNKCKMFRLIKRYIKKKQKKKLVLRFRLFLYISTSFFSDPQHFFPTLPQLHVSSRQLFLAPKTKMSIPFVLKVGMMFENCTYWFLLGRWFLFNFLLFPLIVTSIVKIQNQIIQIEKWHTKMFKKWKKMWKWAKFN